MAGNEEMVAPMASVPVGVLVRYDTNVVCDQVLEGKPRIASFRLVDVLHYIGYAHWKEEGMGLIWMACRERALSTVHLGDELTFRGVDVLARPLVNKRWLSFSVCPHFESLFHLNVAPGMYMR